MKIPEPEFYRKIRDAIKDRLYRKVILIKIGSNYKKVRLFKMVDISITKI